MNKIKIKKILENKIVLFVMFTVPLILITLVFAISQVVNQSEISEYIAFSESTRIGSSDYEISFNYPKAWSLIGQTGFVSPQESYENEVKAFFTLLNLESSGEIVSQFEEGSETALTKKTIDEKELLFEEELTTIKDISVFSEEYYYISSENEKLVRVTCYGGEEKKDLISEVCSEFIVTLEINKLEDQNDKN